MNFSKKILSQTVTQLCLAKGIDHIVISPGSRNAPLTIGFSENPNFNNFSIVDERCAAFFALGIAQQIKKPVALVCTSGSALLNYYPAIAEAFYSDIPLVVLSADRPEHLIDVGDGQTIRQENVFANHILYSASCKEGEGMQEVNEAEINKALNMAILQHGPVHINIPFSEPLYETVPALSVTPNPIDAVMEPTKWDSAAYAEFLTEWNTSQRKMIVVGVLPPNSVEQKYIDVLAQDESVIVLTETTSNLHHENFFPAIDQLIAPLGRTEFEALKPDLLLSFGGMVVSKKIKAFLRSYKPQMHYHIDIKKAFDTYFVLKAHFRTDINSFLKLLVSDIESIKSNYRNYWLNVKNQRLEAHERYVNMIPFSDFKVFSEIFKRLPENIQLQLANSATVRYAQLFELHPSFSVFCNRGTSGIDGSTSTAIGAAYPSRVPTVFLTGDLSFFYDSNALWNDFIRKDFRIIIVNNSGGGIFRILPGNNESENFTTFFETRHTLTAEYLSLMFGFEYRSAKDEKSLILALKDFFDESHQPKVLEVFTPPEENDKVLLDYFDFIS
ncbi:MAG: 2-succinyl-5-enolpyruvyl-6-hydroxy-3-cyclohexene-1-carboxylic-acid synthase [Bacteroidota bacterium]